MTLLQRIHQQRERTRERLRIAALNSLRAALRELLPEEPVLVFGSVIRPGHFHLHSDVDIALYAEPAARSLFRLQAELEERLHRPVDLLLLGESRLRDKIEREGERWMNGAPCVGNG